MIALLLAAQLGAIQTPADIMDVRLPPNFVVPLGRLIDPQQLKPKTLCGLGGRMEAAYGTPTALYREGDRPAKLFSRWQDYPPPKGCLVEAKP